LNNEVPHFSNSILVDVRPEEAALKNWLGGIYLVSYHKLVKLGWNDY